MLGLLLLLLLERLLLLEGLLLLRPAAGCGDGCIPLGLGRRLRLAGSLLRRSRRLLLRLLRLLLLRRRLLGLLGLLGLLRRLLLGRGRNRCRRSPEGRYRFLRRGVGLHVVSLGMGSLRWLLLLLLRRQLVMLLAGMLLLLSRRSMLLLSLEGCLHLSGVLLLLLSTERLLDGGARQVGWDEHGVGEGLGGDSGLRLVLSVGELLSGVCSGGDRWNHARGRSDVARRGRHRVMLLLLLLRRLLLLLLLLLLLRRRLLLHGHHRGVHVR